MRKQAGEENQTALRKRLLPVPSSRTAGAELGVRGKPVGIVSGNVLINREIPLHVCDKAPRHPRDVFVIRCLFPIISLKSPKLPSLGLFLRKETNSIFTDGWVFSKAPGGFRVDT